MQVAGCGYAEDALQVDLPGGYVEEVLAAHDVVDAGAGVVDYDCELVGVMTVAALEDEIADFGGDVLTNQAEVAVVKFDLAVRGDA